MNDRVPYLDRKISMYIEGYQLNFLKIYSMKHKTNQSEVIRSLIEELMAKEEQLVQENEHIIYEYFGG